MIPNSIEELDKIANECRKMTTKAALLSAGGGVIPLPGVDIAADVGILLKLIPEISKKFGLSREQIDEYDEQIKIMIFDIIKKTGAKFAGRYITVELIVEILKKLGIKVTKKQVAKYIPIIGQVISASISYGAMKLVANMHIKECYNIAKELIEKRHLNKI